MLTKNTTRLWKLEAGCPFEINVKIIIVIMKINTVIIIIIIIIIIVVIISFIIVFQYFHLQQ